MAVLLGAGRIRHIATSTLWLQRYVGAAKPSRNKLANLADLGTTHLDYSTMDRLKETESAFALKAELQAFDIKHHEPDGNDLEDIEELYEMALNRTLRGED